MRGSCIALGLAVTRMAFVAEPVVGPRRTRSHSSSSHEALQRLIFDPACPRPLIFLTGAGGAEKPSFPIKLSNRDPFEMPRLCRLISSAFSPAGSACRSRLQKWNPRLQEKPETDAACQGRGHRQKFDLRSRHPETPARWRVGSLFCQRSYLGGGELEARKVVSLKKSAPSLQSQERVRCAECERGASRRVGFRPDCAGSDASGFPPTPLSCTRRHFPPSRTFC